MLSKRRLKQTLAYSILGMLIMLVCQYLISVSDPTENALANGRHNITISESFYVDRSRQLTLDQLLNIPRAFIRQPLDNIPWSFDQQAYWMRLELRNNNDHAVDTVIHFSNPMVENLDIYQQDGHSHFSHHQLGWQKNNLSRAARSIPSYALELAENTPYVLYIRIATEGIAKTPINIYLKDDFSHLTNFTFLIWGSFVGILITMSLYNLVLYAGLRDSVYLVYIGYIISILMMLGVVIGFGHYIWPKALIALWREHIIMANTSVIIFAISFALLFFNAFDEKTKIVKITKAYLLYLTLFALVSLWLPEYIAAPIFFVSMFFLYPISMTLIVQQCRVNYKWAKLYIVSWVPLIIGGAIQPMGLMGVIDDSFLIHHALMIGVLFEIVLMAMALANRMQYKKEKALYEATHDQETGIANSNLFDAKVKQLTQEHRRFAICIFEISDFSTLLPYISNTDNNDLMIMVSRAIERKIHLENNFLVLDQTQNRISKLVKLSDGIFAAIIEITSKEIKEKNRIKNQLEFLKKEMNKGAQVGDLFVNLSINIGISLLTKQQGDVQGIDILKQAYRALEQARREAHGFCFYQPGEALHVAQRLTLAADLQRALREDKLRLYHQPQIDLETGEVDGSEALLRWQHEEFGFIAPDIFIKLAEDTGIINELTLWVIETACRQLKILLERGYTQHSVSINISGKDISEPNFLGNAKAILARHDIPYSSLTFELTESVMVNDFEQLSYTLQEFSNLGIQVSIDDYGTGYSSLFYISQLPFNEIKIDKSFVVDLETSPRNLTIVKTTIEMAKSLGLKVVAEGIESEAIEHILRQHECHIVQGYHYQRPIEFSRYLSWLDEYF